VHARSFRHCSRARGFTLVEITIALVIVGLLVALLLRGSVLINRGKVHDLVAITHDVAAAVREFQVRFRMYPGDLKILPGNPYFAAVSAKCMDGGANAGNNNGVIEAHETVCVPEVLFLSGIIGKSGVDPAGNYVITTPLGNATIVASSAAGVAMPPGVVNVLTLANVPCELAQDIDRALDNGNLGTGDVLASGGSCTPGGPNDPVLILAIGL
jgi:prepilin-type N-terminal cleavage/methylation domain-containing protein